MFQPIPEDKLRRAINPQTGEIISRRQFDKLRRFKETPYKTPEEQRKAREKAGIPPGPGKGKRGRPVVRKGPGDWNRIDFKIGADWETYIQVGIPRDALVVINIYGTNDKYDNNLKPHWFNLLSSTRKQDVLSRLLAIDYEWTARRTSILWRNR